MDSMRHLSTSLPRQRSEPPNDLLADFKAAAMSVTTLYRTATTSRNQARAAGYQEALDDLLVFLDKENMGLMDGEGWRVRQWATERLDGDVVPPRQEASSATDEDDDTSTAKDEEKEEERSSSPEVQRKPPMISAAPSSLAEEEDAISHRRVVSEPPQLQPLPRSNFTFRAPHAYPAQSATTYDREANADTDMDVTTSPQIQTISSTPSSAETVRIVTRPPRGSRQSSHNKRNNGSNAPTLNFNFGSGTGNKRKMPYPDFFDISGINDGSDRKDGGVGGRGGKRRHVG